MPPPTSRSSSFRRRFVLPRARQMSTSSVVAPLRIRDAEFDARPLALRFPSAVLIGCGLPGIVGYNARALKIELHSNSDDDPANRVLHSMSEVDRPRGSAQLSRARRDAARPAARGARTPITR